jgi:Uma2 family endonuclease
MTIGFRFTSADLDKLPAIEGVRYEIIDGELHVSRQPQVSHQYTCDRLLFALTGWNDQAGAGRAISAPGLVFSEDNDVIPDVVWISLARLAEARDEKGHLRTAPELVVEVLSPGRVNEVRDREIKLGLYSRQGVEEYWIADWERHELSIYRRDRGPLRLAATLSDGQVLSSALLPGFACPTSDLWEPPA